MPKRFFGLASKISLRSPVSNFFPEELLRRSPKPSVGGEASSSRISSLSFLLSSVPWIPSLFELVSVSVSFSLSGFSVGFFGEGDEFSFEAFKDFSFIFLATSVLEAFLAFPVDFFWGSLSRVPSVFVGSSGSSDVVGSFVSVSKKEVSNSVLPHPIE